MTDRETPASSTLPARLWAWLHEGEGIRASHRWWTLWILIAALAIRLHWNLDIHPIGDFYYSDMKGYNGRADQVVLNPDRVREYAAFFPFGTAWILAAIKHVFGVHNFNAIGVVFALMGTAIVGLTTDLTYRVTRSEITRRIVGGMGRYCCSRSAANWSASDAHTRKKSKRHHVSTK